MSGPTAVPKPKPVVSTDSVDPDSPSFARSPASASEGANTRATPNPWRNRASTISRESSVPGAPAISPCASVLGTMMTNPVTMNGRRPRRSLSRPIGTWNTTFAITVAANCTPNRKPPWPSRSLTTFASVANSARPSAISTVATPSANTGSSPPSGSRTRKVMSSAAPAVSRAGSRTKAVTSAKLTAAPTTATPKAASNPESTPTPGRSYGPAATTAPATSGPKPKPTSRKVLKTPKFPPRLSAVPSSLTSATVAGMMSAPPNPCTPRITSTAQYSSTTA